MHLSDSGEFELIERWAHLLSAASHPKVLLGIGDDAACLDDLAKPVFSCDALVENIHFRHEWILPRQLGWKAMAVNISDMAAMGAAPVAAVITLALPPQTETRWVEELYNGFADAAHEFHCVVVGGDTTRADQVMINVAMIGELITSQALRRDGAQADDVILVTGFPGESAAGLALLQKGDMEPRDFTRHCIERHLRPQPRIPEIRAALKYAGGLHAAIDISDGISGDAAHIARRSNVDIIIETAKVPLSAACRETAQLLNVNPKQWTLAGGEDYELLLCVAPAAADHIAAIIQTHIGTPVHRIGTCATPLTDQPQVRLFQNGEEQEIPGSWRHF